MRWLAATTTLIIISSPAFAQSVGDRRFDPASGDYFVWVMNDALQMLEMRVVPPNKVLASVSVKVQPGRVRRFRYAYRVEVLQGSRQPLSFAEFDCPASAIVARLTATAVHEGVRTAWSAEQIGNDPMESQRHRCELMHRGEPLESGGTLEVEVETVLLPAIGELRLFGATGGFSWPTSDPIAENEPATRAVHEVDGFGGGWKSIAAVVPTRDPESITGLDTGVSVLRSDLARTCGRLRWITSNAVCAPLSTRLQHAGAAVTQGKLRVARSELQGFLGDLARAHKRAQGRAVNDAAFSLLRINAEYLLGRITSVAKELPE
jgi:hypothetical protein